jgi:ribose 5-phosphate isomerase A
VSKLSPDAAEAEKAVAAEAAATLVEDGMAVGLGTGSTVAHLLVALGRRRLDIHCVATSPATAAAATALGMVVGPFDAVERLDIAIDGTDQVAPDWWLVKGGGGAHTREKVVAATADRFVVIADSSKPVPHLAAPIPLELSAYGLASTLRRLTALGEVRRRDVPVSPDGGVICDYLGEVGDPAALAAALCEVPGVVAHGLFAPSMVSDVVIGRGASAEWLTLPAG